MTVILKLEKVTKSFSQAGQKIEIIKNADFSIKSSEFLSLIGPSGSGKTTLLQICGMLDNPSSGAVIINGENMAKANDEKRTKIRKMNIGFVYQFHHLLPEFSALENVALPLLIQDVKKNEAYQKASEILSEVGLHDRLDFKPSQLSGGQQQRVAIARAIVAKPKLILADEPTGNLDYELSEKIFDLLKDLTKKHQIACLIVTHNLELAKKTDKILKIKNGEIEFSLSK
jgi:lipoprotein-releasing system ATP-binding protein